jgi:putative colanic acid biosynthesis UDP-glucose lipid carrier transferase
MPSLAAPSASASQAANSSVLSWGTLGEADQPGEDRHEVSEAVSAYLSSRSKRLLDVTVALFGLLLLAPLMIAIVLAIRVTSPGPALFRQSRGGRGGVPFTALKFRSMVVEAGRDLSCPQARPGDPRVTWVGGLLRRTSLDELPQLINVLQGEMSLVGPRPHALAHDAVFAEAVPEYARRFSALPGITGLAQVNGCRGETPTIGHVKARVQFDLQYIETASLAGDLRIIALTVAALWHV